MEIPGVTKRTLAVLGVFLLCMLLISFYEASVDTSLSEEMAGSIDQPVMPAKEEVTKMIVYVSGAVKRPGVVSLAEDARVYEAVEVCGGLLPTADSDSINMAAPVKDGMQVKVGEKATLAQRENRDSRGVDVEKAAAKENALVNINTADEQALLQISGVGPKTAAAIIEYRQREGSFEVPEDLKKVSGIGEKKFERIKTQITL